MEIKQEQDNPSILLLWDEIDTRAGEHYSDEQLLELVKYIRVFTGWGLIAEICKRFSRKINGNKTG